jgi:uncharacterized Tic20 family protein
METTNEKSLATITHLSALSQYIIPLGNYIFPILIWSTNKDKSKFIDYNGKQVLNFQLSILIYTLVFAAVSITAFLCFSVETINKIDFNQNNFEVIEVLNTQNITGLLIVGITAIVLLVIMKVTEFILLIYGATKAANNGHYKYPLTINFIK